MALLLATGASAQELWGGLSVGMTREQVASRAPQPEQIAGAEFAPSMQYKDDRLVAVLLKTKPLPVAGNTFRTIEQALSAKYGPRLATENIGGGVLASTWQRGPVTIRLTLFIDSITVRYDAHLSDISKKL